MGNKQEKQFNEEELKIYLKEGLTMNDLINLKKAFISLDKDEDGKILYDIKKISDIDKYDLPVQDENGKILISFDQFMNIMTENIIINRKKFGNNTINYESETSIVMCIFYPFKKG
jgi:Ca2+-binding EF-hand superfamily protein